MTQVIGESLPSDVNFFLPTEKLNGFVFSEDISWASALRKLVQPLRKSFQSQCRNGCFQEWGS